MNRSSFKSPAAAEKSTKSVFILVLGEAGTDLATLQPKLRASGVELLFAQDATSADALAGRHAETLCAVVVDAAFRATSDGRELVNALRSRDGRQLPALFIGEEEDGTFTPRDLAFAIKTPLASPERTCRLLVSLAISGRAR
jgi:hypothetical protein